MSTIKSETWDEVTAPAIPSGWNASAFSSGTAIATQMPEAVTPISSPNVIFQAGTLGLSGAQSLTWATQDGNGGNVQVIGTGNFYNGHNNSDWWVFARGNNATWNPASHSGYAFVLSGNDGAFEVRKYVSGTPTTLFSRNFGPSQITNGDWYRINGQIYGSTVTTLQCVVTRLADGYTFDFTSGDFTDSQNLLSITDSSSAIQGEGYAGIVFNADASASLFGDDWSLSTFSLNGMAATGGADTASFSGGFKSSATASLAELHDLFAGASKDYYGALSRTESHDAFASSATATAASEIEAAEAHDVAAIFARVSPYMQATEHRDSFAGSATAGTATNRMAAIGGGDVFGASGGFSYDGRANLYGIGKYDVFAGAVIGSASATTAATEHGDIFASASIVTTHATMAATAAGDTFRGGLERVAYHVYANTGAGDPINYDSVIDTTAGLTYATGALSHPGTWSFGVRAFWVISGLEEQNLDCYVTFILDTNGRDVTNRPAPPTAIRAFPLAGGAIRAEWIYPPTYGPKTPTGFHVYTGVGAPSYTTPTATVAWGTGASNSFVANMTGFSNDVTYTIGVRAYNAVAEEANTNTVTVTAITVGPAPVDGLVGVATAQSS